MPKDYKNMKSRGRNPGSAISHVLSVLTGLCLGLLVALYVYYFVPRADFFGPDKATPPPARVHEKTTQTAAAKKPRESARTLPEPKFDFYKILPNREINISEWIADNQEKAKPVDTDPGLYIFQVGSFKDYESADQVKAQLALIGIQAEIQRVVINGQDSRHRVRIGPYKDPEVLEDIRKRLDSHGLEYMLLKLRLKDSTEG